MWKRLIHAGQLQGLLSPWFFTLGLSLQSCPDLHSALLFLFSCSVVSDSSWPHRLQYASFPCPSPSSGACSNSCPLSWWCHPTSYPLSSLFSSCFQSYPASGSFPVSWLVASGGRSIETSASVLPVNIQGWFPLELIGLSSLHSKGLSRVFSNTTVQKHQFLGTQPFLALPSV